MDYHVSRRVFLRRVGLGSVALALSACQPAPAPPVATTAAKPAAATAPQTPEDLTLPIVTQPLTLTYWAPMSTNVAASMKSFGEMGCYVELEKRTGIHLDFQHPPLQQEQDQFNLLVASGKYPDVIEFDWLHSYAGGPTKAIKDGVIIRLNDPIDRYAPNIKKILADHPEWRKQLVTDEGDIYCFPFIRSDPLLLTFIGPVIRADWLDKLALKVPATLDEWHTMLKAFKDQNANGKGDTLPFSPWLLDPWRLEHVVRRGRLPAARVHRCLGHPHGLLPGQWHGHVWRVAAGVPGVCHPHARLVCRGPDRSRLPVDRPEWTRPEGDQRSPGVTGHARG